MEKSFICPNNHNFDISKQGYVNLLPCNQKQSKDPGDSKKMIEARNKFLQKDFYKTISDSLNKFILKQSQDILKNKGNNISETGCGTGYYLKNLRKFLLENNYQEINYYGLDISKHAMSIASKSDKDIKWIVANSYNTPLLNNSQDIIINIFAPYKIEEIARILKPNGKIYFIVPSKNHLNTFRKIIYENRELEKNNDKLMFNIENSNTLKVCNSIEIKHELIINNNEDIMNLLYMTPYYWNMDAKILNIFKDLNEITITLSVIIVEVENKL